MAEFVYGKYGQKRNRKLQSPQEILTPKDFVLAHTDPGITSHPFGTSKSGGDNCE
jgi:hypothetical protein